MPSVNPGPATTSTQNSEAVLTPVNTQVNSAPQGSNALRILGEARGVNANAAGDTPLPVVNASRWVVQAVVCTNASATATTNAFFSLNAAPANAGTTIVTAVALASLNATTFAKYMTVTATATVQTGSTMYVNVGTTLAGSAATFDVFVYGYDLS